MKSKIALCLSLLVMTHLVAKENTMGLISVNAKSNSAVVTLNDIIINTNATHPAILQKRFEYEQTVEDKEIAKGSFYPTLNVTSSSGYERNEYTATQSNGEYNEATVNSTLNLYNGGLDKYDYKYYDARRNSSKYSLLELKDKTILDSINAYIDVLKNYELYILSQKVSQRYLEFYEKMKKKYENRAGTLLEISKSKGLLDSAMIDLNTQKNAYDTSIIALNYYNDKIKPENQFLFPSINFNSNIEFDDALQTAYDNHPSLRVALLNKEMASNQYYRDKNSFMPKLDLKAEYTATDSELSTLENNYDVKLELRYNLFNGLKDYSKTVKNRKQINEKIQLVEKAKLDIKKRLALAYNNHTNIENRLKNLMNYYRSQTISLYSSYKEYLLGKTNLTALVQTEEDYVETQKNIINANYNLLSAKFNIIDTLGFTQKLVNADLLSYDKRFIYQDLNKIEYSTINIENWLEE